MAKAMPRERASRRVTSPKSRRPSACDVIPLVPMRRKPNIQYITLNVIPPTAIAPMYAAAPRWPTIATSTSPKSGTVMLLTMDGRAILSISLLRLSIAVGAQSYGLFLKGKRVKK